MTKSNSAMDVDADDRVSICNSQAEVGSVAASQGFNASVASTPGTTIVGSTADSIAPSDLASDTGMMDVDEAAPKVEEVGSEEKKVDSSSAGADEKKDMEVDGEKKEGKPEEKKEEPPEPTEEILKNPCR